MARRSVPHRDLKARRSFPGLLSRRWVQRRFLGVLFCRRARCFRSSISAGGLLEPKHLGQRIARPSDSRMILPYPEHMSQVVPVNFTLPCQPGLWLRFWTIQTVSERRVVWRFPVGSDGSYLRNSSQGMNSLKRRTTHLWKRFKSGFPSPYTIGKARHPRSVSIRYRWRICSIVSPGA